MAERETKYCSNCGAEIDIRAEICPECGVRVEGFRKADSGFLKLGDLPLSGKGALVGAVTIIIGAFLPWMSGLGSTVSGLHFGMGKAAMILGAIAAGTVLLASWGRGAGALSALLGFLTLLSVKSTGLPVIEGISQVGSGVVVALLGGYALIAFGAIGGVEAKDSEVPNAWYLAPVFLGVIGGAIAWLATRGDECPKPKNFLVVGAMLTVGILCLA